MDRNAKVFGSLLHNYFRWNLGVFPIENGKKILDLGCGPCLYYNAIREYGPELYVATDYSANYVRQAEKLFEGHSNCRAVQLDLISNDAPASLSGQKFDYVVCLDVIEHIEDEEKAVNNIKKIMVDTSAEFLFGPKHMDILQFSEE